MNKKKMIKLYLKNGVVLPRLNAYEALEKLVERDTPFKVKPILNWCKCSNRVYPDEKFCKECGQRLEWEE